MLEQQYSRTTWSLTKSSEKKLNGNYTRKLLAALNKSWKRLPTKQQLRGHLPPISQTMQVRNKKCIALLEKQGQTHKLLWTPVHRHTSFGQPRKTYINQLCVDTGYCLEDLPRAVTDWNGLWQKVKGICIINMNESIRHTAKIHLVLNK